METPGVAVVHKLCSVDRVPLKHFHSPPEPPAEREANNQPPPPPNIPIRMGLQFREFLAGPRLFGCSVCKTHLASMDNIISRQFNGQHGRAYLFATAVNITLGEAEDRPMTTGLHTVRDILCSKCGTTLGWKYEKAYETNQKYKEGKVILEKSLLVDVV